VPEVARSRLGVVTYLAPERSLDDDLSIASLDEAIDACVGDNEINLVVDLGNVNLLTSASIERLLDAQERLVRLGGGVKLASASAVVTDTLRITNALSRLAIIDADEEADGGPSLVPKGRLGDVLVGAGLVTEAQVQKAIEHQKSTGARLGAALVAMEALGEADLLQLLGRQFGIPYLKLRTGVFDPVVATRVSAELCEHLGVLPLQLVRGVAYVATSDPQALPALDTIAERLGVQVRPVLACADAIRGSLREAHGEDHNLGDLIGSLDGASDLEVLEEDRRDDYTAIDEMATGSPVINLVNGLIQRAVRDGASDIHIEPGRGTCRVRFRIDGVLYPVMRPPMEVHPALVSRLKVMANLDIAERRLPQDGRVQVSTQGRIIDLRFSSLPGIFGEKVVMRVLDAQRSVTELAELGMSAENLGTFGQLLTRSNGLILATGPTGSGKTTTLYAALAHLNSVEKSIVTIEDPVEYQVDLINQNQIRPQVGLTFPRILKHVLRQDPDIIMVGEIRERETAEIAVQAALTGHLVLSALHTNDSVGAITRLLDMGIEPFLLSSALAAVVAQRLLRTVCPDCRTSYVAPPGSLARYGVEDGARLVQGRGCESCYDSGYKGRVPIHELLVCDSATQRLMVESPSRDDLSAYLAETGVRTLRDAGIDRALEGVTTLEEAARVVNV
jgi:type IV pilus assembly protein PilB